MSLAACTVVTRNHLAFARLVGRSWTDHHPGSSFTVVVVDHAGAPPPTWVHREIEVIGPDAIGIDEDQLETWAAIYGPAELACVLKPAALKHVLAKADAAVYIDGDVEVLDPMDDLEDLARARGVVLSPHTLAPLPRDDRLPDRFTILKAGMFNGGLLAVGRSAVPFLDWWAEQLHRDGVHEPHEGLHGDQRWLDFVPSYFDHHILRDPTFNVAYWNLHERPATWDGDGLCVVGRRVRCFHYSGLVDDAPWLLSHFVAGRPRVELRDHPAVARACRRYADRLRAAGIEADRSIPYRYAATTDGTPVDRRARRLWRAQLLAADADPTGATSSAPSPFAADGGQAWLAWLRAPAEGDTVGRYLRLVWYETPSLQWAYPDLTHPFDRAGLTAWALDRGPDDADIPVTLLPDPEDTTMDDSPRPDGRPHRPPRLPEVRSQLPVDSLDAARQALALPLDGKGTGRGVRRVVGQVLKARDQRHDDVARSLADAVDELAGRVAELGTRVNRVNDELPEHADRLDRLDGEAKALDAGQIDLDERVDQLDQTLTVERERIDGALEQDVITGSILADAETRLTAEVADLQLRVDKLIDDEPLDTLSHDEDDQPEAARK